MTEQLTFFVKDFHVLLPKEIRNKQLVADILVTYDNTFQC